MPFWQYARCNHFAKRQTYGLENEYLIGIENKIFHTVQNDLADYDAHLQSFSQLKPGRQLVKIVLGLHTITDRLTLDKMDKSNFSNVHYPQFFAAIKSNLGHYLEQSHSDYLLHLKELMRTIENLISSSNMNTAEFQFFKKYERQYLELTDLYNEECRKLIQQIRNLQNVVESLGQVKMRIYKDLWLYWYSPLAGKCMICVEAEARFAGWFINVSVRNNRYAILPELQAEFARNYPQLFGNTSESPVLKDGKILVELLPLDTTLEALAQKLLDSVEYATKIQEGADIHAE